MYICNLWQVVLFFFQNELKYIYKKKKEEINYNKVVCDVVHGELGKLFEYHIHDL